MRFNDLLHRYNRRHPAAFARLITTDLLSFARSRIIKPAPIKTSLQRILLATPAHLGDAIILTAIIRAFKEKIPDLEIDVLCGSWAKPVFEDHPGVTKIHCVDLPLCNRSIDSEKLKFQQYKQTLAMALESLSDRRYDFAASVYAYEPSFIPLLSRLRPKTPLAGFVSAGYGPRLSKAYRQGPVGWHEIQHQAQLFEPWLGSVGPITQYRPWLSEYESEAMPDGINEQSYVVVHPGTGAPAKEWPTNHWAEIIDFLLARGGRVIVTGYGSRESELVDRIIGNRSVVNLVNRLNFRQFSRVVSKAELLIGVDSVAGHLAAAYGRPGIVIAGGTSDINRWRPLSNSSHVLNQAMPCSPCHSRPCAIRHCITGVTVDSVINCVKRILT